MSDEHSKNFEKFSDPTVVDAYAAYEGLQSCEKLLFEKFIKSGSDILDLGVGGGRTTPYLSAKARRYVGVDYSEGMIATCRRKYPDRKFLVMDASDLTAFNDNCFDIVVFSFNGLAHLHPR